jgi:hypothetical protein
MTREIEYSQFAQYFVEISETLDGLESEVEELVSEGKEVPLEMASELYRHTVILDILTHAGKELYNKSIKELYQDGWKFWFKEDAELREMMYGGKSK